MRVLIATASRHEATAEIGRALADAITQAGHLAVVLRPEQVTSVVGYDAVVLGSGVYAGRWLEPARKFAEQHAAELVARPVWLFSSGPVGDPPKPEAEPVDVAPLSAKLGARGNRVFPGRLDRSQLGFAERAIVRVVKAPDGDFRPWPEIVAWANEIATELDAIAPAGVR